MSQLQAIQERRVEKFNEAQKWAKDHAQDMELVLAFLAVAGVDEEKLTLAQDEYSFDISFSGDRALLNKVWGTLRKAGLEPESRLTDTKTTYVTMFWHPKEGSTRFAEGFQLFMQFSSTSCRQVRVGTRMVEQVIYDIQCVDNEPGDME